MSVPTAIAHRTALCAEPVARNDGSKIPHFIGATFGALQV
jgi:hypothetical protein